MIPNHLSRFTIERDRCIDALAGAEARFNAELARCHLPAEKSFWLASEFEDAVNRAVEERLQERAAATKQDELV